MNEKIVNEKINFWISQLSNINNKDNNNNNLRDEEKSDKLNMEKEFEVLLMQNPREILQLYHFLHDFYKMVCSFYDNI